MKKPIKNCFLFAVGFFYFFSAYGGRSSLLVAQSFYVKDSMVSALSMPTLVSTFDNQVLIESGLTNTTNGLNGAGAAVVYNHNEHMSGFLSLGLQHELFSSSRAEFNSEFVKAYRMMQNPVSVLLSFKNLGQSYSIGVSHSGFNDKVSSEKESSLVAVAGAKWRGVHLNFNWVFQDSSTNNVGSQLQTKQPYQIVGLFEMDSAEFAFKYTSFFQVEKLGASESASLEKQKVNLSYFDETLLENINFNYRIEYESVTVKDRILNTTNRFNTIPIGLGFKNEIATWLNLKASIKQSILVNQGTGGLFRSDLTTIAVATEIQYNQTSILGILSGLSGPNANQKIDGTNFLSQVSLIYKY